VSEAVLAKLEQREIQSLGGESWSGADELAATQQRRRRPARVRDDPVWQPASVQVPVLLAGPPVRHPGAVAALAGSSGWSVA
jgi:hypothetical protein